MQRVNDILRASILWRALMAVSQWVGEQWANSRAVQAFLAPSDRSRGASDSSIFARLWKWFHHLLCLLYEKLRLDKLFGDSIFSQLWLWCALTVALAPLLPTMVTAGLGLVCVCSLLLGFARRRSRQLVFTPINKYIMLYAVVYAAGTVTSVAPADSLPVGLLTVFFTLFALVPVNAVDSRERLERLVRLMVLAGALVSLYGMYQFVFRTGYQSDAWVDNSMFSGISFRVASTFENPNMLGQYLVLMIPLGGACLLNDIRDRKKRWLWLGCCGVMCICMLMTFSRGGWLALLCAGLVFFVLINPRLLMAAPFGLVALYFVLPDTIIQRFTSIGNLADHSTSYRVSIWMGSLRMLKDYWLCGVGPGQTAFNTVYPTYSYDAIVTPHSHNLLLQITSDAGICALIIFCVILWCFFRWLCAALHREKDSRGKLLQIAFVSGAAGFMVQAMTDYSFYNYRVMFLFWVYLALGMTAARWSGLNGEEEP
ncbi:MAG: O-antigen ligase family protein [Oscillospiraceae bacterium]|nr:O-antigen ligase family protein [Oscillospiraceae bacterium]